MNSGWVLVLSVLFFAPQLHASGRLTKQQLSQQLPTMISLASETEMFTGFIASEQSRTHFTREHAAYLLDSVQEQLKKLEKKDPDASTKTSYDECRRVLLLLQSDLSRIAATTTAEDTRQIHAHAQDLRSRLRTVAATL
jgi:hypothetical protein